MIVRDLLIKLGFQANTSGADKIDGKIVDIKRNSTAAATAIGTFASQLAMMGAQKAAAELQAAAESSIDFGRSMANVSSIMADNPRRVKELADAAKALGTEFGVLPKEVADAMYGVIGNLGDTKDTVDQVRQSMLLAKSGAASTSEAFGLLSAVTRAYGDTSAGSMKKTANLASAAVRLGSLTLPQLAQSIQAVTPVASSLGVSLEELFTVQASLSGVTGDAAEVYTQMQSAMTALLKQTPQMEKAFKKAFRHEGIKTTAQAIGKYGLQGTLQKLIGTTNGTQEQMVDLFGRIEGVRFAMAVTGNQAADYTDKLKQMHNVDTEVTDAVAKQTHGMGAQAFALDKARAEAEKQRIELGDKLAPAYVQLQIVAGAVAKLFGDEIVPVFSDVTDGFTDMGQATEDLRSFFKGLQKVLLVIADLADGLLTVFQAIGIEIGGLAGAAGNLGDWEAMKQSVKSADRLEGEKFYGFTRRHEQRSKMLFGEETDQEIKTKFRQRRQRAQDSMEAMQERVSPVLEYLGAGRGSALGNFINNMGGVNIAVSVAPGTEASAAARIGDTLLRASLGVLADGVQRSNPVQAPPPQVASVAPSWGKLPGAGVL